MLGAVTLHEASLAHVGEGQLVELVQASPFGSRKIWLPVIDTSQVMAPMLHVGQSWTR